jgi:hypothetical protein
VDDVYQLQSWTNREGEWFWVPKATTLYTIEKNLGFPATAEENRRFHPWSRKVVKARSNRVDGRSFMTVLKQEGMERGREGGYRDQGIPGLVWVEEVVQGAMEMGVIGVVKKREELQIPTT